MVQDKILIAGGGIGGLAAALALAQKGIPSLVLEKASQLGEIGAGIQLGPNAFHCFDRLGIGDAARAMAVYVDTLRLMDAMADGEIAHIDLGETFRKRFGNPYAVVHRGDLHGVLLKGCRDHELIELRTNADVTGYDQDGTVVAARLANGETVRGTALIGADGLWSNVRRQVTADGAPRVSGHTTYRSVIPTEEMPEDLRWNAATLWAGPKCHIVHYPLSGWKVFNLVVTYHNNAPEPVAGIGQAQSTSLLQVPRSGATCRNGPLQPTSVCCTFSPMVSLVLTSRRRPPTGWRGARRAARSPISRCTSTSSTRSRPSSRSTASTGRSPRRRCASSRPRTRR